MKKLKTLLVTGARGTVGSYVTGLAEASGYRVIATDMSRVIQGLIAGVGFLGAGTILKGQAEEKVQGLTTAAGIWMTAAIGMAAGLGLEVTAVLSTLLALAIFSVMPWIIRRVDKSAEDSSPAIVTTTNRKDER